MRPRTTQFQRDSTELSKFTAEQTYTTKYQLWLLEVFMLETEFGKNPNKETATALSNRKNIKWADEDKYTPEYLVELNKFRGKRADYLKDLIFSIR